MHKHHHRGQALATKRRSLSTAIAFTLALGMAGPVLAQQAAPATDAKADPQAKTQAQELDTVTVTANKREENIREVAVAITKISDQQLENFNSTQMSDFANYVPGLQLQSSGTPGQTQVSMRGIASLSPGSTVGSYIDETPLGSNGIYQQATLYQLDLLPYDVDSIEVLRGPQGTLYGAGAMGGLIKYTMKKPDLSNYELRVGAGLSDVQGGDDMGVNYRFGVNVPLVQDQAALRMSYSHNDVVGYVDNLVDGRKDINQGDQDSFRLSGYWKGETVSVQASIMEQKIDSPDNATIALDPTTKKPIAGLSNYVWVDEPFKKNLDYYALTVNWDVGFADFVSATSYSDTDTVDTSDLTGSYGDYTMLFGLPSGSAYITNGLSLTQFTQEFRLASKTDGPFEWLLGAFYSNENGKNHQFVGLNQVDQSPLPPPFDAIAGSLGEIFLPSSYTETAVFANGAYKFNDRFKLGAGVRYSSNDQKFSQIVTRGLLLPIGTENNTSNEDVFTWSISPQFQINDDNMVYFKASTGYQPGGPNIVAVGLPSQVDSSTLTSYELGLKSAFSDNRVFVDLVGYHIDWKDIQVASLVNGVSGLVNGGKASSDGLEAAITWRPIDGLTLGFTGSYNNSDLSEDFPTITVPAGPAVVEINTGLKGDRMPYVPDVTYAFTADYYLPLNGSWSMDIGGGYRWVDSRTNGTTQRQVVSLVSPPTVLTTDITPPLEIDSYQVLDLFAAFSNEHWTARVYMKNATDERAYSTMADVTSAVTGTLHHFAASPIQPRTFGLEVDYRF
ncbi:MAG TPA: TonB-dependent receptor [Lysobacter sp.]|nr:TonB-dependent receptor [Lysobacter sp.]